MAPIGANLVSVVSKGSKFPISVKAIHPNLMTNFRKFDTTLVCRDKKGEIELMANYFEFMW